MVKEEEIRGILEGYLLLPEAKFLSAKYTAKRSLLKLGFSEEQVQDAMESFLNDMAVADEQSTKECDEVFEVLSRNRKE